MFHSGCPTTVLSTPIFKAIGFFEIPWKMAKGVEAIGSLPSPEHPVGIATALEELPVHTHYKPQSCCLFTLDVGDCDHPDPHGRAGNEEVVRRGSKPESCSRSEPQVQ